MEDKAIRIVEEYLQTHNYPEWTKTFIVWSCYTLGNRKYMIGINNGSDYFEITYNYTHREWYLDRYILQDKQVIK